LRVNKWTLANWEKGVTRPAISFVPRILDFLGYDPGPEPIGLPYRLLAAPTAHRPLDSRLR
jgi:hypothetical protein